MPELTPEQIAYIRDYEIEQGITSSDTPGNRPEDDIARAATQSRVRAEEAARETRERASQQVENTTQRVRNVVSNVTSALKGYSQQVPQFLQSQLENRFPEFKQGDLLSKLKPVSDWYNDWIIRPQKDIIASAFSPISTAIKLEGIRANQAITGQVPTLGDYASAFAGVKFMGDSAENAKQTKSMVDKFIDPNSKVGKFGSDVMSTAVDVGNAIIGLKGFTSLAPKVVSLAKAAVPKIAQATSKYVVPAALTYAATSSALSNYGKRLVPTVNVVETPVAPPAPTPIVNVNVPPSPLPNNVPEPVPNVGPIPSGMSTESYNQSLFDAFAAGAASGAGRGMGDSVIRVVMDGGKGKTETSGSFGGSLGRPIDSLPIKRSKRKKKKKKNSSNKIVHKSSEINDKKRSSETDAPGPAVQGTVGKVTRR